MTELNEIENGLVLVPIEVQTIRESTAMTPRSSRHRLSHSQKESGEEARTSQQLPNRELPIHAYVPAYLKNVIFPCHGDFCQTPVFHYRLIAQLMAEGEIKWQSHCIVRSLTEDTHIVVHTLFVLGFLPIATQDVLLPKLHRRRCVIRLPDGLHVKKSLRKKSKRFSLSVNRAFDSVIQGCHDQHGSACWLYPPLVKAFRELNQAGCMDAMVLPQHTACPVRMYSIEVWNEGGVLAGGELGYTVGSIYTSLTGFFNQDNAGSVQLAALGRLLSQAGFTLWDLGMDMNYKQELGSQLMPRSEFVEEVKRVRVTHGHLVLPTGEDPVNCKTIIDRTQPVEASSWSPNRPVHPTPLNEDKSPRKKARGGDPESTDIASKTRTRNNT